MDPPTILPAHETKHLSILTYPFGNHVFDLFQSDDGRNNGSALWLGAQCLSLYLAEHVDVLTPRATVGGRNNTRRAIDLGSGIGLMPLALAALGWTVYATDTVEIISSVLERNISSALASQTLPGSILVRELNWTVPPNEWKWDDDRSIASPSSPPSIASSYSSIHEPTTAVHTPGGTAKPVRVAHTTPLLPAPDESPRFDLVVSSDTIYSTELVQPFLRTLHHLCSLSASTPPPIALICIERRDPALIDATLASARTDWGFSCERVPHRKVAKAMRKKGGVRWSAEAWEGVEIWKLRIVRGEETALRT